MPRPRKLLPAPCPICEKENGTVQLVVFNPKFHPRLSYRKKPARVVLRIGHYSPKLYKDTQEKVASTRLRPYIRRGRKEWIGTRKYNKNLTEEYTSKKHRGDRISKEQDKPVSLIPQFSPIIKPWGTEWHSFVINDSILVEVIDYHKSKRDIVSVLVPIEKVFQRKFGNELYESKTFPLPQELFIRYQKNGWPLLSH
jgi:hypothetical protein